MTLFHLFLVAVIQGITEFLPISSSGHLILLPQLTGLQDQGQAVDVAVHVGTLGAVVLYFWRDVRKAIIGVPKLLRWQMDGPEAWLALYLAVATIPATPILVHQTERRSFHLAFFDENRCQIRKRNIGAMVNRTKGLRTRR